MELHALHIHRSAAAVHCPGQVKAVGLGGRRHIGVDAGADGAVLIVVHISKAGLTRKGISGAVSGNGAVNAGQQNTGEGDAVLFQQVRQRIVLHPGPGPGLGGAVVAVAPVVRPGGPARGGAGIGDRVVPDGGRLVVFASRQGVPVLPVLGDPDLAALPQTAAIGIAVAVDIEVHAIGVVGIVGQRIRKIVRDIAAEVAQALHIAGAAGQGDLRLEPVTGVGVLAVDAQVVHHRIRPGIAAFGQQLDRIAVGDAPVGGGDGDGLSAGLEVQRVDALPIGRLLGRAHPYLGALRHGIGQGTGGGAVGHHDIIAVLIRGEVGIPVSGI